MQADKYVPMHLRRKKGAAHAEARTFEMMPATGSLQPGHRQNVQVKFMPSEQVCILCVTTALNCILLDY